MVTSFIGGVHVDVESLTVRVNDDLVLSNDLNAYEGDIDIIALDFKEAGSMGFRDDNTTNIHFLYKNIPVPRDSVNSLFYDPAALPFIGQKVMNVLAELQPFNYPYFQRKLAEFRTRLQSTVLVGRKLLEGVKIFNVSMHGKYLLQAAGCEIKDVPENFFEMIESPESIDYYIEIFSQSQENGLLAVADVWTPKPIKDLIQEDNYGIILPEPRLENEIILYLHQQYLSVWDEMRQKDFSRNSKRD